MNQQSFNKNAAYFRARAREMLKDTYKIALLIVFLGAIFRVSSMGFTSNFTITLDDEDTKMLLSPTYFEYFSRRIPELVKGALWGTAFSILFSVFLSSPVMLGYQRFFLSLNDGNTAELNAQTLFKYFSSPAYLKSVQLNLLHSLILTVPFLISLVTAAVALALLAISPFMMLISALIFLAGYIASTLLALPLHYSYTYAHMIMAEFPELSPTEALRNSRSLMQGRKWKLFCLDLSFIGWILLTIPTCGIGMLFLLPYMHSARAAFYHDAANREAAREVEFPSIDPDDYAEQ